MQILLFIYILHSLNLTKGLDNTMTVPYRRSSSADRLCPAGCASCSAANGCLSCKPRLFFHLELDGMRQKGVCLSSCPRGYYGRRSPRTNTCNRCKEECHSCFSEHFCTRCPPGRFLFWGKCEISCPDGLTANTSLRECTVLVHSSEWVHPGECSETRRASQDWRGSTKLITSGEPKSAVTAVNICSRSGCMRLQQEWRVANDNSYRK